MIHEFHARRSAVCRFVEAHVAGGTGFTMCILITRLGFPRRLLLLAANSDHAAQTGHAAP